MESLKKTPEELLAEIKKSLEDLISWSDELPDKFIVGSPAYARHKFRGNWFQGVYSDVSYVANILKDIDLKRDIEEFTERKRLSRNKRTTREEINEADQLIRRALEKLQNNS